MENSKGAKVVELKVQCEKKQFKNDQNEMIDYISITTVLEGQQIKLSVSKDSKQLFNYLIDKYFN